MGAEIERKFLVKGEYRSLAQGKSHIVQGYLFADARKTIRIRIRDDKAYVTIKGPSADNGLSRFEWEAEISVADAQVMIALCEPGLIDKDRYLIPYEGHVFEVDEFHGENEGLVIAEVELKSPVEEVALPAFIGAEVTGDKRYYNSHLREKPFVQW